MHRKQNPSVLSCLHMKSLQLFIQQYAMVIIPVLLLCFVWADRNKCVSGNINLREFCAEVKFIIHLILFSFIESFWYTRYMSLHYPYFLGVEWSLIKVQIKNYQSVWNGSLMKMKALLVCEILPMILYPTSNKFPSKSWSHQFWYYIFQFNPSVPVSPDMSGFIKSPKIKDRIHVVAFVVDASTVDVLSEKVLERMKTLQTRMNQKGNCYGSTNIIHRQITFKSVNIHLYIWIKPISAGILGAVSGPSFEFISNWKWPILLRKGNGTS